MSNYTEVSVSGYNSSPPPDDGSTGSDNEASWAGIKSKLTDPLKTAIDSTQDNITTAMDAAVSRVPVGTVLDYAGLTEPTGFLFCYGQAISRSTYSDLFTALSTTYGSGDGSTTFNVPDLRGRVVAGQDDMGGSSANRLTTPINGDTIGAAGGAETVTLAQANLPSVNFSNSLSVATTITNGTNVWRGSGETQFSSSGSTGTWAFDNDPSQDTLSLASGTVSGTVSSGGSGTGATIVQPTFILNKIIKY